MNDEIRSRIAHALERLAPSALPPVDLKLYPAYVWHGTHAGPVEAFLPARYDLLSGIDEQKGRLFENTRRHAAGLPAHDVLLWGSRGTGKSASVGAVVGATYPEQAEQLRRLMPRTYFLVPGYGAQGYGAPGYGGWSGWNPFTGPILDQDGKERYAAGVVAPDGDLLGMNWYVKGVDDKLPQ